MEEDIQAAAGTMPAAAAGEDAPAADASVVAAWEDVSEDAASQAVWEPVAAVQPDGMQRAESSAEGLSASDALQLQGHGEWVRSGLPSVCAYHATQEHDHAQQLRMHARLRLLLGYALQLQGVCTIVLEHII